MTRRAKELLDEALALDPSDRADMAATLLESLDDEPEDGIEEAWAQEVERRVAEVESGAVRTIPWSEARQVLLKRLGAGS
jgi:putative addiction module component (TIGR02574 family)